MLKKTILLGTSALVVTAIAAPTFAQDDTIIVTATKREQTLQETPVAVSVTSADTIEKARITDIKDLQSVVPSFRVSQLQNSANTSLVIRGFGNGGNNKGIEPAVGVFIDGVYRSRAAAQISDLPNLQRVEVLSGPQSTLFGKNASAGVVSVVTSAPDYDTGGYLEAGLGNYNLYQVRGYATTGLSENVAVSLGGGYQKRDGYFEDQTGLSGDMNDLDRYNIRGQLLIEPSDNLSVRVIADMSSIDENCCGTGVAIEGPLNGVAGPSAGDIIRLLGGNQPTASDQFSYETYLNRDTRNKIDDKGISAQVDYDFDNFTLTSITSFRTNENVYNSDNDFNSLEFLKDVYEDVTIDTFTQEVRLTSTTGDRFDWMVGGYYFDESIDQSSGLLYGDDTRSYLDLLAGAGTLDGVEALLGLPVGTTFFADDTTIDETFTQEDTAYSIFGTVDFHATDRLTATVGLNYTSDEKDVAASTINNDVFSNLDLQGADGIAVVGGTIFLVGQAPIPGVLPNGIPSFQQAFGLAFTPANVQAIATNPATAAAFAGYNAGVTQFAAAAVADPATNPLAGLFALQFQPQFLTFPNSVEDGNTKDEELTHTLRVAYEVNDNFNVYGSWATGFKSSSWNLTRDSRPFLTDGPALQAAGLLPNNYVVGTGRNFGTRFALPEEATVFELGLKARFENGAFNVAVFDQTIENFQSTIFQGTGFVLANAGEQSTTGIEFDATYDPIEPLRLTFATTLLDPVYDSFPGAPGPNGPQDLSGQKPSGIPEVSLSTSATWTHDFTGGSSMYVRGDYQYESEVQVVDNIVGLDRKVSMFNGSVGYEMENGLAVQVWGRNLFNDEHYTSGFPGVVQANTANAYPNQPRTYGIAVRKDF